MAKMSRISDVKMTPRSLMTTVAGWELTGTLGRGSYGHVRGAVHKHTGERMACKIQPLLGRPQPSCDTAPYVEAFESHKELVLLKALQGGEVPGVINVEGVHYRDGLSFVIMPMYKTTAYKMKRDRAPPSKVIPYFYKLLLTIRALHDLHVSHGDLKPNNVLTDTKGNPVLVDFGFSLLTPYDDMVESTGGTCDYESPEKAANVWHDPRACDIWALGILLLELLGRPHPYAGDKLVDHVLHGQPRYEWTRADLCVGGLADLIQGMLHRDPGERFDIAQCLEHPFFRAHSLPRPSTDLYSAPSPVTLPKLPHQLPNAVINDLLFLAHTCGDFVLCQTEAVVLDRLKESEPRWEKVWVGMIYDGWCALKRKESKRRPPGWRASSCQVPVEASTTKLKRIDLSPVGDKQRPQPRTPRREPREPEHVSPGAFKTPLAPLMPRVEARQILAPKVVPARDINVRKTVVEPAVTKTRDEVEAGHRLRNTAGDQRARAGAPKGPRSILGTFDAAVKLRDAATQEERTTNRLGPPRRPGLRQSVRK